MPAMSGFAATTSHLDVLDPSTLNWVGVRFLDPLGRVFELDGDYYRAIYSDRVPYVTGLFESDLMQELADAGLVVSMQPAEFMVEGFGLVLKMPGANWAIPGHMYTLRTLRSAALTWLRINELLMGHGLGLADAHLGNFVLFGRCRPLWVDLGSIKPVQRPDMGFNQFVRCQLYPLWVLAQGKGLERLARLLIQDGGVTQRECRRLVPLSRLRCLPAALVGTSSLAGRVARRALMQSKILTRKRLIRSLRTAVESASPSPAAGAWTSYRAGVLKDVGKPGWKPSVEDPRPARILELIDRVKPETIMDVGANDGYFAAMAAVSGAKVLAIDTDEGAIDKFNQWVTESGSGIEAFACVGSFHRVRQQADLVLGLALVHHLAISQKYKFDYIANRFAEMSREALITEFMPNGLGQHKMQADPLPPYYKLDVFLSELKRYFAHVEVVEYARPGRFSPRTLIFCAGRVQNDLPGR